jgi:protein AbiQ
LTSEYFPLRQLTDEFYEENTHLERILDKEKDSMVFTDKGRGYGVIVVEKFGKKFGIPLRSNMTHKYCFSTKITRDEEKKKTFRKGLDYTKAVILEKDSYISTRSFKIPAEEFDKINDTQHMIETQFGKFIDDYIKAYKNKSQKILDTKYRDSTLINYHKELGLVETIAETV